VKPTIAEYVNGIRAGNIAVLSRAITLAESTLPAHNALAEQIIEQCLPYTGRSVRVGITGVPGVGKSSFIEKFGTWLVNDLHKKVAVLAIDPTSSLSKGSILGDKTRMEQLSVHPAAFIRPSPAGASLGGVARKTREAIYLCEAAGFDVIIVETVGVGQSETAVHSMVDFFLLLMLAGAGDELQGIKRGIIEMADALIITKADGDNIARAKLAATEYRRAMHLLPAQPSGWLPRTGICSAQTGDGVPQIWDIIEQYVTQTKLSGHFEERRKGQAVYWMEETIAEAVRTRFFKHEVVKAAYPDILQELKEGRLTSYTAASKLLGLFSH
jgi:LAO/AO transport system kinase